MDVFWSVFATAKHIIHIHLLTYWYILRAIRIYLIETLNSDLLIP